MKLSTIISFLMLAAVAVAQTHIPIGINRTTKTINEPAFFSLPNSGALIGGTNANGIDWRLVGKTASNLPLYTTQVHTGTPAYVRSTTCWAAGIDLMSASVWNSHFFAQGGGV